MSEIPSNEDLAQTVRRYRREVVASLIAIKGHLDTPYPDDPRWTPWTRFVERALQKVDEIPAFVDELVGRLEQAERERDAARAHSREASELFVRSNEQVSELLSQQSFLERRLTAQTNENAALHDALEAGRAYREGIREMGPTWDIAHEGRRFDAALAALASHPAPSPREFLRQASEQARKMHEAYPFTRTASSASHAEPAPEGENA